mmetsp:Transcript_25617/g.67674  ORF Transcript_25617/g.67674 Transcript_25617/m.67674 type:complete len:364 (+) Transcript_25617:64-1155(+)
MGVDQSSLACCQQGKEALDITNVDTRLNMDFIVADTVCDTKHPDSTEKSWNSTVEPDSPGSVESGQRPPREGGVASEAAALPYAELSGLARAPGYMGSLTPGEAQTLEQLRLAVSTGECHDGYAECLAETGEHKDLLLLRFLRARKFDLQKALGMLQADLQWRQETGVAQLSRQPAEAVLGCDARKIDAYLPVKHIGYDKQGRPVIVKHIGGKSRIAELLDTCCSFEQIVRYHIWQQESYCRLLHEQSQKLGVTVEQLVVVVDTKGFYLSLLDRKAYNFIRRIAEVDSGHYPERLGLLVVANASSSISAAWRVMKKLMDERTQKKIHFASTAAEAGGILLQHIEADQLPQDYGGTAPLLGLSD